MLRRLVQIAVVVLLLPFAAAGAGVLVVTEAQGSGAVTGGSGAGAAIPAQWRMIASLSANQCPGESPAVLEALGWLATGAGRRSSAAPPPWASVPSGPFGLDESWRTRRDRTLLAAAAHASAVVCGAIASGGGLQGGLLALLGSPALALDVEVAIEAIQTDQLITETRLSAVAFAATAIGLPYLWGGNGPDAYDCSGLMVAAFRAGGVRLERTAQEQHDQAVPDPSNVPGDMVFFGAGPAAVEHVGLIIGGGLMIDAPHTGAFVRIESYSWSDLVSIGRAVGT